MEFLATASTFATLTGFAMQLYSNCKWYIGVAKDDCPNDLKLIMVEAASLEATLRTVKDILDLSDKATNERLLRQVGGPAHEVDGCLKRLLALVPTPMKDAADGDSRKRAKDRAKLIFNAVTWAASGKKGQCDFLLKALREQKATLSLGLTTELSRDVRQMADDIRDVKKHLSHVEEAELYKWLEKINPSVNHNHAGLLYESETCQWLTKSAKWRDWLLGQAQSRILWVHGIPGAGKTVLSYYMVEELRRRARHEKTQHGKKQGVAYYYCYHQRNTDETVPFLTWVLSQLCRASNYIPETLKEIHDSGCEPTWRELLDCLAAVLTKFDDAYIVVDAVDETSERANLLRVLAELGKRFHNLHLAVTSREESDIVEAFHKRSVGVSMSNEGVSEDIRAYVASALQQDTRYRHWPAALRDSVAGKLPVKARGMFRYAACHLEILGDCTSTDDVSRELSRLPESLDETYERILLKIKAPHRANAALALAFIMGSHDHTGPVRGQTLVDAVASWQNNKSTTSSSRSQSQSLLTIEMLRRFCSCLIKVQPGESKGESYVDLAHYTVREFLQSDRVANSKDLAVFALKEEKVDEIYCSTVLSAAAAYKGTPPDVRNIREDVNGDPVDWPLYALRRTRVAMFWSRHTLVREPSIKSTLLALLDPYNKPFRGLQLLGSDGPHDMSHEIMFEWLAQFNPRPDERERLAAHLTMIVGFEDANLVKEFLEQYRRHNKSDPGALFRTPMTVVFPVQFDVYRKTGKYEKTATQVTVLDFYNKGKELGYDTKGERDMLRTVFGAYLSSFSSSSSSSSGGHQQPRSPAHAPPKVSGSGGGGGGHHRSTTPTPRTPQLALGHDQETSHHRIIVFRSSTFFFFGGEQETRRHKHRVRGWRTGTTYTKHGFLHR
ncbi:uncharacterized protein B0T15DRAFT_514743 [Chaetomium strumarium]|uniref:Nephrocystin 3-like N-terminal domain-containing protein n=1 Tax=Chaetomium strumarium TaxID=1170767 RepID=A0AAJ0GN12_9PEZI|nr:hypothetical protein B0T15DRAFT_514743 [Chaetomium strumarium]